MEGKYWQDVEKVEKDGRLDGKIERRKRRTEEEKQRKRRKEAADE